MPENRVNKTVGQLKDEIYIDQRKEKEERAKSIIRDQIERRDRAAEIYGEERRKTDKLMEMTIDEVVAMREDWTKINVNWGMDSGGIVPVIGPTGVIRKYDDTHIHGRTPGIYDDDGFPTGKRLW